MPEAGGWTHIGEESIELGDQIGGGGVALVYKGWWGDDPVAIKTLFDPKVDAKLKQEYMDELLVMSELKHRNVVTFYGACMEPPRHFFVMELCDRSLYELLHGSSKRGIAPCALSVHEKLQLACDVADGMAYLHARKPPIVHRDLKTHNVLQASNGVLKICDFGLVRTKNSGAGTPSYMAPELFAGKPFNSSVDVYAFGVLLCELFSGEQPFYGYDYMDLRRKVPLGERPELPRFDTPEGIRRLIKECWDEDPGRRPTFEDVVDAVDAARDATPAKSNCELLDSLDEFGGGGDCLDSLMMGGSHK